nr:hypothetical protein [Saprospiraceae bacterium]
GELFEDIFRINEYTHKRITKSFNHCQVSYSKFNNMLWMVTTFSPMRYIWWVALTKRIGYQGFGADTKH